MGNAIIIGSIIFLIIILAVIIINRQRMKIKLYQIQALLDELEIKDSEKRTLRTEIVGLTKKLELRDKEAESMKETQRSIEELKINVRQLFRSKWETVNIISSELYVQPTNQIHYNAIINKLKKQIERFKSTSYKQELEKEVDKHLDGIVSRLRKECVFLNEKHIEFLILNYSGFSVKTICLILDIGEKTFYSRRSRIRDKILKSDLSDKNIFLKYIQ